MPYLITTITADDSCASSPRRTVATLDEVQAGDFPMPPIRSRDAFARLMDELAEMPASGGTIGPLPNGTIITVEPTDA